MFSEITFLQRSEKAEQEIDYREAWRIKSQGSGVWRMWYPSVTCSESIAK